MSLADQILTDLDAFISTDDFAVTGTWTPSGGTATEISCIYDNRFEAVDTQGNAIEGTAPMVTVKTTDVEGIRHGDSFVVNSVTYKVRGIQADGTGLTLLILSED